MATKITKYVIGTYLLVFIFSYAFFDLNSSLSGQAVYEQNNELNISLLNKSQSAIENFDWDALKKTFLLILLILICLAVVSLASGFIHKILLKHSKESKNPREKPYSAFKN